MSDDDKQALRVVPHQDFAVSRIIEEVLEVPVEDAEPVVSGWPKIT